MRLVHLEEIGSHYVRTLAEWRQNVHARIDEVKALGLDDAFVRLWDFYLCYCEGGFAERTIGDAQLIMERSGATTEPLLPSL